LAQGTKAQAVIILHQSVSPTKLRPILPVNTTTERFTDLGKLNFPMVVWF